MIPNKPAARILCRNHLVLSFMSNYTVNLLSPFSQGSAYTSLAWSSASCSCFSHFFLPAKRRSVRVSSRPYVVALISRRSGTRTLHTGRCSRGVVGSETLKVSGKEMWLGRSVGDGVINLALHIFTVPTHLGVNDKISHMIRPIIRSNDSIQQTSMPPACEMNLQ